MLSAINLIDMGRYTLTLSESEQVHVKRIGPKTGPDEHLIVSRVLPAFLPAEKTGKKSLDTQLRDS